MSDSIEVFDKIQFELDAILLYAKFELARNAWKYTVTHSTKRPVHPNAIIYNVSVQFEMI